MTTPLMIDCDKLEPCPFCGGKAGGSIGRPFAADLLHHPNEIWFDVSVRCRGCGTSKSGLTKYRVEEGGFVCIVDGVKYVTEAWNRRTKA